jgi:hypothetical protein
MMSNWIAVTDELPPIGERVEVRHDLNHSYDCTGVFDGGSKWSCANAFIVPPCFLVWNPTHWRPIAEQEAA